MFWLGPWLGAFQSSPRHRGAHRNPDKPTLVGYVRYSGFSAGFFCCVQYRNWDSLRLFTFSATQHSGQHLASRATPTRLKSSGRFCQRRLVRWTPVAAVATLCHYNFIKDPKPQVDDKIRRAPSCTIQPPWKRKNPRLLTAIEAAAEEAAYGKGVREPVPYLPALGILGVGRGLEACEVSYASHPGSRMWFPVR